MPVPIIYHCDAPVCPRDAKYELSVGTELHGRFVGHLCTQHYDALGLVLPSLHRTATYLYPEAGSQGTVDTDG